MVKMIKEKIIPTIIKNYKNNMTTCVKPANLKLNFINVTSIIKIIENILIKKKISFWRLLSKKS